VAGRGGEGTRTEPVRWMDSPAEAPHGAAELLRAVEPPPPLDDATRARVARAVSRASAERTVIARVARFPHRGWLAAAAAVLLSAAITATVVRGCDEPAVPRAPTAGPATSMQPVGEDIDTPAAQRHEAAADRPVGDDDPAAALDTEPGEAEPDRPARETDDLSREPRQQEAAREQADELPEPVPERVAARPPPERASPRTTDGEGSLMINTSPWSRVYLDGRDIGNTPIVRHRVAAGRHTLVLHPRGDADQAVRRTIVVEAGHTHRVVLRL